jgi:predicted transcriptional regulator
MITKGQKEKIKSDARVRMLIALEVGVTERTILNWVKSNSKKLEVPALITAIKKHIKSR